MLLASERKSSGVGDQACAVLLINLDRSPERLQFQLAQAKHIGIEFQRIQAVDGSNIPAETYRRHAYRWQRALAPNEVACLLSHARCWQWVAETGRNAVILEDDVVLAAEFPAFLEEAATLKGCQIVNLETRGNRSFLSRTPFERDGAAMYDLLTAVSGAAGYLITPEAAAVLLDGLPQEAGLADNYVWGRGKIQRLQTDPAFCMGLDIMQAYYKLDKVELARSSIANKRRSRARKLWSYCRHPLTGWRRVKAQTSLGLAKTILPWFADYRVVPPHSSILANYKALRGVYDG